jgi:hypothetical protein
MSINKSFPVLKKYGYQRCVIEETYKEGYEKIAFFGDKKRNTPAHLCKQVDKDWWISKLGADELIKHKLFEMENGIYGNVIMMFNKPKEIE